MMQAEGEPGTRRGRPLQVSRSSLLLTTVLLGLTMAPLPSTPASASCAAPYLEVRDGQVLQAGESVVIEGRAFVDGCRDSMSCSAGLGCDSCEYNDPPPEPRDDVRLQLVQRGRTWDLAVADAGSAEDNHLGWVTWRFELPPDVKPGPARLLPDGAQPVRIRIR